MNSFPRACLAIAFAAVLAVGHAHAQRVAFTGPAPSPVDRGAAGRANAATIGFVGGQISGVTLRFAADCANVLDDGDNLRILPIVGRGGYDSAEDLLYLHGVDVTLLPTDTFRYWKKNHMHPGAETTVQYVAKLYDQTLHILARPGIDKIEDLAHQKVSADLPGTASSAMASDLFAALNIPVEITNESVTNGIQKLKQGDVAAAIFLVGQPSNFYSSLPAAAAGKPGLHFLPVPITPALLEAYLPVRITHASYPNLVPDGQAVDTVGIGEVMAVYAWPTNSERYLRVKKFVDAFFAKFPQLQKPPSHPLWLDVNLATTVPGWTRWAPAEEALKRASLAQAKP